MEQYFNKECKKAINLNDWATLLLICLLLAIIALVYQQITSFEFSYDDSSRIKEEPLVNEALPFLSSVAKIFSNPTFPGDLYRPLTTLAYRVEYLIFQGNAAGFHFLSLCMHAICSILAFLLFKQLGFGCISAFLTSLLFAVHPINVESVASIAGQAELLSASLGLLGLLCTFSQFNIFIKCLLTTLFFSASIFAKESGLTFPILAILCAYTTRESTAIKSPLIAGGISFTIYLIARVVVLGQNFLIERPIVFIAENPLLDRQVSLIGRILPALQILGDYLKLLLLPIHLSLDYSRGFELFWKRTYSFEGFISAVLAIAFAIWAVKTKNNKIRYGICWYFLSFAATCNLLFPIGTIMAERLCYVPSLGFILVLVSVLTALLPQRSSIILILCIALAFAIRAKSLSAIWQSDRVLLLKVSELAPDSPKAQFLSGKEYLVIHKDYDRAEFHLRQALSLDPLRFGPMRELTNLSLQKGEYGRAEYWARKSLEIIHEEPELKRILSELEKLKQSK